MSEDKNTEVTTEVVDTNTTPTEDLGTLNEKLYTEVKALRTESKERRLKLEAFEKEKQERDDAELSTVEKLTKERDNAVVALKDINDGITRTNLHKEFVDQLTEAKLDPKIAGVVIPSDLSSDNMKDKIKGTLKEWSAFIKDTEEKSSPQSPYSTAQPVAKPAKPSKNPSNQQIWDEVQKHSTGG